MLFPAWGITWARIRNASSRVASSPGSPPICFGRIRRSRSILQGHTKKSSLTAQSELCHGEAAIAGNLTDAPRITLVVLDLRWDAWLMAGLGTFVAAAGN